MNAGDLGTRWVLLAALGGLVFGGVLAWWRRRRAEKDRAAPPK
jgi:membrane associated rhomboid family serine protease